MAAASIAWRLERPSPPANRRALTAPRRSAIGSRPAIRDPQSAVESRVSFTIDVSAADARGRVDRRSRAGRFRAARRGLAGAGRHRCGSSARAAVRRLTPPALDRDAPRTNARRRSKDDARLFAIFLDEYHVDDRRQHRARARGAAAVRRSRPDAARSRRGDEAARFAVRDPADARSRRRAARDRELRRAARGEYEPRNAYERDYIAGTPARIEAARNQVALSALNALAVHLGSLADRRKTLVVATEGIGRRRAPAGSGVPADARHDHPIGEPLERRRLSRSTRATARDDPAGEALRRLARRRPTARRFAADADAGLQRAAADSSAYYLLSFRSRTPTTGNSATLQAQRQARRRARARAERVLGRVAGRGAAHGAAREDQRAEAGRAARAGAARQHAHPPVVRGLARSAAARRA